MMRQAIGVLAALLFVQGLAASSLAAPQDVRKLKNDLRDSNAKVRQAAVGKLAKVDSAEAWEAVAERALGDTQPRVADEAQLQIGRATWSEALGDVLDSKLALTSRSALVRTRTAEALGRLRGAIPPGLLVTALKDKEPTVRAAAAFALEKRLGEGGGGLDVAHSKAMSSLRKTLAKMSSSDRDERARASAISALSALAKADHESVELASQAIARTHKFPLVRAASLWAARDSNTVPDLAAGIQDPSHGVAMMALRLLERRGDRDSAVALSRALLGVRLGGGDDGAKDSMRPALAWAIVRSLRDASGLSHGPVADRWVRWAEGLDEGWKRGGEEKGAAANGEAGSMSFYGLRLVSDRLVFLVDMSGSMWTDTGGTTRKAQVEVELAKALRGLPKGARFNLIPYANAPGPWKDGLVPATDRNVERAIQWFEHNTLRGKGDLWTALMQALESPEVDTVVILSDGAPSGGEHWNVALLRTLLEDENRFRGVVIHAVMFDASKFLRRSWKEIVQDWGGVQQLID